MPCIQLDTFAGTDQFLIGRARGGGRALHAALEPGLGLGLRGVGGVEGAQGGAPVLPEAAVRPCPAPARRARSAVAPRWPGRGHQATSSHQGPPGPAAGGRTGCPQRRAGSTPTPRGASCPGEGEGGASSGECSKKSRGATATAAGGWRKASGKAGIGKGQRRGRRRRAPGDECEPRPGLAGVLGGGVHGPVVPEADVPRRAAPLEGRPCVREACRLGERALVPGVLIGGPRRRAILDARRVRLHVGVDGAVGPGGRRGW
jgi:hypothetical protein